MDDVGKLKKQVDVERMKLTVSNKVYCTGLRCPENRVCAKGPDALNVM